MLNPEAPVYLGSLIKLSDTKLELPYLEAVEHSLRTMSGAIHGKLSESGKRIGGISCLIIEDLSVSM
jgi:hypothetical protein